MDAKQKEIKWHEHPEAMRLLKYLYLLGYDMAEIDQVVNSDAIDLIYASSNQLKGRDIRALVTQIRFRKMNAVSDCQDLGIKIDIDSLNNLCLAERMVDEKLEI